MGSVGRPPCVAALDPVQHDARPVDEEVEAREAGRAASRSSVRSGRFHWIMPPNDAVRVDQATARPPFSITLTSAHPSKSRRQLGPRVAMLESRAVVLPDERNRDDGVPARTQHAGQLSHTAAPGRERSGMPRCT